MKKRILSLLLIMAMLLSVVPMIGAAEEASNQGVWYGRSLTLGSGIAINFVTAEAVEDFGKVEFEVGGKVVQRYSTAEEGQTTFTFTRLSPSKLGQDVTAKIYNTEGVVIGEITTNVLSYCEDALAGSNAALKKLCVDLLNYGAATQTYVGSTDAPVNAELTDDQKALGTSAYFPVKLATDLAIEESADETSADWYGAGLILNDTITMRLQYTTETADTYVAVVVDGSRVAELKSKLVDADKNLYEVYYNGLKPSEFSVARQFLICQTDGTKISEKLTYSMESYAYAVKNNPTTYADEVALVEALTDYCRSSCELKGHSFTYGVCDSCGVEKVDSMTSDSITIQAEDAVLNVYNKNDKRNLYITKTGEESTVYTNNNYSGITYNGVATANDDEGAIIVYVTPQISGAFTVNARVYYPKTGGIGILVEDDSTTTESTYTRIPWSVTSSSSSDFKTLDMGIHEWTAGKTYAIRILAASSGGVYFDEFVIAKQHVHSTGDTWEKDETGHWKACSGCEEKVDYAVHTYTNGVCECGQEQPAHTEHTYTNGICTCGKERVFEMEGTSITINAQDAVLNTDYVSLISNNNVTGRQLVKLTADHSAYIDGTYVTSAEHSGDVVVYVKPTVSGTYSVVAKIVCTMSSSITGVMIEDIDTEGTQYTYLSLKNAVSNPADFTTGNITEVAILGDQEWIAGHTYAIRIAAGNKRTALDQFVITLVQ